MQYQSSCAPKQARKCEIKRWFPCDEDGRAAYGHVITKFSGMGRFTYPWCSAGALRAPELRYKLLLLVVLVLVLYSALTINCLLALFGDRG